MSYYLLISLPENHAVSLPLWYHYRDVHLVIHQRDKSNAENFALDFQMIEPQIRLFPTSFDVVFPFNIIRST